MVVISPMMARTAMMTVNMVYKNPATFIPVRNGAQFIILEEKNIFRPSLFLLYLTEFFGKSFRGFLNFLQGFFFSSVDSTVIFGGCHSAGLLKGFYHSDYVISLGIYVCVHFYLPFVR